jgi:hypothetical protein
MDKKYIWAFMYNPMIEESAWATVSLHKTKRGAEVAMEFHKNEAKKEYEERKKRRGGHWPIEFGAFEAWGVQKLEIFE